MSEEEQPLGTCCQRLFDELNAPYDYRYLFERNCMLTITAGYTEATGDQGAQWIRVFAHYCPFCATRIMPESARRKN